MIPKAKKKNNNRIPHEKENDILKRNILFSFDILDMNEYFNLDGTCANWPMDLFLTMQKVSKISVKRIYAGEFSGKNSPFRIHSHANAKPPCEIPQNISLELNKLWQIRISANKGGIHGFFIDNVFHVLWLDPQHNLYPDENHGGLVKIVPPSTCCKERDDQIRKLEEKLKEALDEIALWEEYYDKPN